MLITKRDHPIGSALQSVSFADWRVMTAAARARIIINERLTHEPIPDWLCALAKAEPE